MVYVPKLHIRTNRLWCCCCVPGLKNTKTSAKMGDEADGDIRDDWSPPAGIEHITIPAANNGTPASRYPQRHRQPPDRY